MKKFKLNKIDLKKLVILNIILTIFLGSALGLQLRIPPFDIFKDKYGCKNIKERGIISGVT